MVVGALEYQAFMYEVIEHGAVDAALFEQVGVDAAHGFIFFWQDEGLALPLLLARLHWRGRYVLSKQHLHGVLKAGVEIFAHEVDGGAALVVVVVEPSVAADGDVAAGPFKLRAGAPQCFAAGLEEGGEIGLFGGVELVLGEGDVSCDNNSSLGMIFWLL